MKHIVQSLSGVLFLLGLQLAAASQGAEQGQPEVSSPAESLFAAGRYEASVTSGVLFSPFGPSRLRPTIDYTLSGLQFGYMPWDVKGNGWWRGNFEAVGEAFGGRVFDGPGSYLAGGTAWLRYNFVPRNTPGLVPYLQGGVGAESIDVDRRIVGQAFNFNVSAAAGLRYFVGRNWSLNLEFRFQHLSNANMAPRNLGINAAGPMLGVSYFF